MKKKLIAAVLSFAMAVAPMSGVEAKQVSLTQKQVMNVTKSMTNVLAETVTDGKTAVAMGDLGSDPVAQKVTITNIKDGKNVSVTTPLAYTKKSHALNPKFNTYQIKVPAGYGETNKDVVIPINVKSRGVLIAGCINIMEEKVSLGRVYIEPECINGTYLSNNMAYLNKGGKYYVKISSYEFNREADTYFALNLAFVSGADTLLKNKTNVLNATMGSDKPNYYKISVSKTSKVIVSFDSESNVYATLCNGKKAAMTNEEYIGRVGKAVYVVPKGSYYLKVKAYNGFISTTATYLTVTNSGGASKSKAGTLKVNGSKKNVLFCPKDSTSRAYYVKFSNSKRQKIKVYLKSSFTSGKVQFEIFDSKGRKFGSPTTIYNGVGKTNSYQPYTYVYGSKSNSKTLPKGTYYIKFKKLDKKTSGIIEVNVKNK